MRPKKPTGVGHMIVTENYIANDSSNDTHTGMAARHGPVLEEILESVFFYSLDRSRPQIPRIIQSAMRSAFVLLLTCSLK